MRHPFILLGKWAKRGCGEFFAVSSNVRIEHTKNPHKKHRIKNCQRRMIVISRHISDFFLMLIHTHTHTKTGEKFAHFSFLKSSHMCALCSCYWRHQIKIFDWTQFEYRLYEIASQQEFNLTIFQSHSHIFIFPFYLIWPSTMESLPFLINLPIFLLNIPRNCLFNTFLFSWSKCLPQLNFSSFIYLFDLWKTFALKQRKL